MFQTRVVEKMKTHISWQIFLFSENRAVYGMMWKNVVQPERAQMAIRCRRDRFASGITKAHTQNM
jgi:hypothetical protein